MLKTVVLCNIFVQRLIEIEIFSHIMCLYCHYWSIYCIRAEWKYSFILQANITDIS